MFTETLVCMRENDPVWWLPYPNTQAGATHTQSCPHNGSAAVFGIEFIGFLSTFILTLNVKLTILYLLIIPYMHF